MNIHFWGFSKRKLNFIVYEITFSNHKMLNSTYKINKIFTEFQFNFECEFTSPAPSIANLIFEHELFRLMNDRCQSFHSFLARKV